MRQVLVILLAALVALEGWAASTPLGGLVVENFRVAPERYPAPDERQNKYVLEAGRAQPVEGGRFALWQARLKTFKRTGELEMEVSTPECQYDPTNRSIASKAALNVATADGRFAITGEGFFWGQTNSNLVISNRVHTHIASELIQPETAKGASNKHPTGPLEISSERFVCNGATGYGEYDGNVSVLATNLDLRAGKMKLLIPGLAGMRQIGAPPGTKAAERSSASSAGGGPKLQIRNLEAEHDVALRYGDIQAKGQRAIYAAETGLLEVFGEPSWTMGKRAGHADVIRIERENRLFISEGHAVLTMPIEGQGFPGFSQLAGQGTSGRSPAVNRLLEISCARYVIGTNTAGFWNNVNAREITTEQPASQLSCQQLSLTFANTNELTSLLAEQKVAIWRGERRFDAERLDYDAASGLARFTVNPSWRDGPRRGAGRVILVHTEEQELEVRGDATLQFPAGQVAPAWAGMTKTNAAGLDPLDLSLITSRNYRIKPSIAVFEGGVRLLHPRMDWECERMTMHFSPGSNAVQRVIAEPRVQFSFTDPRGQLIKGSGDQAVYSRDVTGASTNAIVELTGSPASLRSQNGVEVKNRVLLLDVTNGKFVVPPGGYRITGNTNVFSNDRYRGGGTDR